MYEDIHDSPLLYLIMFVTDSLGLLTRCGWDWVPVSGGIRQIVVKEAHNYRFSIHPKCWSMCMFGRLLLVTGFRSPLYQTEMFVSLPDSGINSMRNWVGDYISTLFIIRRPTYKVSGPSRHLKTCSRRVS